MNLKTETAETLKKAAQIYETGQCGWVAGQLWRNESSPDDDPQCDQDLLSLPAPDAVCLMGAIFLSAGTMFSPVTAAAQSAVIKAAWSRYGMNEGKTDVAWLNDEFLPSVKTGEGLSYSSPEALAAGLLRHAAAGVENLPGEFDHSIEGANRLGHELEQARQRELEEHGPVIVHDGFTDPE